MRVEWQGVERRPPIELATAMYCELFKALLETQSESGFMHDVGSSASRGEVVWHKGRYCKLCFEEMVPAATSQFS